MAKGNFTLPRGTLVWPKLNEPDDFKGKKQYKVRIEFNDEDHRKVDAYLKKLLKEGGAPSGKSPWYKDKKTGKLQLVAKSGDKYPPGLLDAKGNEIPRSKVRVGGGTVAKVNVSPNVYDGFGGGLNLYLNWVQIISLQVAQKYQVEEEEGFTYDGSDDDEDEVEAEAPKASHDDDMSADDIF